MILSTDTLERGDIIYLISEAVAGQIDADIRELPPLYDTIDPEALVAFLRSSNSGEACPERSVEFVYCDHHVTVDSTGKIKLHQEAESPSSTAPA